MKEYGSGKFKLIVTKKDGSKELHRFGTRASRNRFVEHNKFDRQIADMKREED